jgi:hypothetical protein
MPLRNLEQRQQTLEADHLAVRRFLEQFRDLPILFGQLVDVTVPNGTIYGKAFHALKRSYVGGFVVNADGYVDIAYVVEPNKARTGGFDVDPTQQVLVSTGTAVSADTIIKVWLF